MRRLLSRLRVGLVVAVLGIGAVLVPVTPAIADEPTPAPTVEPSPTAEPTPEPSPTSDPDEPATTPAVAPPVDEPDPTVAAALTIAVDDPAVIMNQFTDRPGELYSFVLEAAVSGVDEPGVSYAYQWYRVNRTTTASTAISGATNQSYRPGAADYPYELKVRATVKKTGYTSLPLEAEPADYSVRVDPSTPLGITDLTPQTGNVLGPVPNWFLVEWSGDLYQFSYGEMTSYAFSWRRNGATIGGADETGYEVVAADVGTKLSYKLVVQFNGWLPLIATSPSTGTVTTAPFASVPTPQISQSGMVLTVDPADSTPMQTSRGYQWYRNGVAVTGKTAVSYTLTQADWGKEVTVKVTYKRSGYVSSATWATTTTGNDVWSVLATPTLPVIRNVDDGGTIQVGSTLKPALPDYSDSQYEVPLYPGADEVLLSYQWYRNGVALSGKTAGTYLVVAADKGQTLTVRVTAFHYLNRLVQNVATSAGVKIGSATIAGSPDATVVVASNGTALAATVVGITEAAPVTYKYQWYRDSSAITGKTASTYAPTSADQGKDVWVRVTISKAAIGSTTYTTVVRDSARVDYSISPYETGPFIDTYLGAVGSRFEVVDDFYVTPDGYLDAPTRAYQWYRNGVAISGATAWRYTAIAADYNTKLGVRLTITAPGYATLVHTISYATPVVKGVTVGTPQVEVVPAGAGKVKAQLVAFSLEPDFPAPTYTYQWYRDNPADAAPAAKITGATSSTYTLTSSDRGRELTVQLVMKRTNFTVTTTTLPRPAETDYTIVAPADAKPTLGGTAKVGETLTATPPSYFEADGTTPLGPAPTLTYTWYRSGTAISGQTTELYMLTASDLGKKITVKVRATVSGRLAHTSAVSLPTVAVALGTITLGSLAVTTGSTISTFPKVKATITGAASVPGSVTFSFQWYRDNPDDAALPAKISGATSSTYSLTSSDTARVVTLVVTVKKTGYASATFAPATAANLLLADGAPFVYWQGDGPPTPLVAYVGALQLASGGIGDETAFVAQWFRNGSPISGATGPTYAPLPADYGAEISVRVTYTVSRHATLTLVSDVFVPPDLP